MKESLRVDLERYLDGAMTPDEAAAFLAAVRQDREAMAVLARVLEDEAHLFDALRETGAGDAAVESPRRHRRRRPRFWPNPGANPGLVVAAGLAAAVLIAVLALSRPSPRSSVPSAPHEVVVQPAPLPSSFPSPPRREPERPEPLPTPPAPRAPREETTPPPRVDEPPAPRPPEPPAPRDAVAKTLSSVAVLERLQGECFELDGAVRNVVKVGAPLLQGRGLHVSGSSSLAVVRFADGTRLDLGGEGSLREIVLAAGGKRIVLETGSLAADVAKQPAGAPFVVQTPQAEIVVVGTRFSVLCQGEATRVEVREGRVKATRRSDSSSTEVSAGQCSIVAAGAPVVAKPFPVDEILLVPAQGKIVGADWRAVRDAEAGTGTALEALRGRSGPLQEAPHVAFTFSADAEKTYVVWVRGKCLARSNRVEHDAVVVEFPGAEVTEPPGPNKGLTGSLERALFNGFMHWTGYGWIGGDADDKRDVSPVTVRFARAGRQTIKLYVTEGPVRIDAIWLSATQKTRPEETQTGPTEKK